MRPGASPSSEVVGLIILRLESIVSSLAPLVVRLGNVLVVSALPHLNNGALSRSFALISTATHLSNIVASVPQKIKVFRKLFQNNMFQRKKARCRGAKNTPGARGPRGQAPPRSKPNAVPSQATVARRGNVRPLLSGKRLVSSVVTRCWGRNLMSSIYGGGGFVGSVRVQEGGAGRERHDLPSRILQAGPPQDTP